MAANAGKSEATFEYVNPEKLRFDPANPRFAAGGAPLDQDAIQALLEKEPHYALELVPSFLENGFIDYEPLVVRADGSKYVVVEGNRRLAAIRHVLARSSELSGKSDKLDDLKNIPVLVFASSTTAQREKEQRVYLGVRHLFGFREWPPESKARYLDAQVETEDDVERLTRELNIKRQDIQRYLIPYRLRKAAGAAWQPHRDQDFWALGESLSRSGIKTYIGLDVDRKTLKVNQFDKTKLEHLLRFIYGTPAKQRADRVVKETRQLSTLGKLLQDKRAAAALEKGRSLAEASVLVESIDESRVRLQDMLREGKALLTKFDRKSDVVQEMLSSFDAFSKAAKRFLKHER